MEVRIVSKEVVKPSSPETIETKPPHKLCLFDQLTPLTFVPTIHFYTYNDHHHSIPHLKRSLSETLNIYYPFSGRTHPSNLFIHNFNKGLPFTQAQVNSSLTHFLKLHQNTELLNLFLPRQPFQREDPELQEYPVMELQVSVFSCGGIALGWTSCHKLIDGSTLDSFLATFSAFSRGSPNDVVSPNFSLAAELFPPRNPPPRNILKLIESLWFTEADYVTRRFVFAPSSISRIRSMVPIKLSRVKALSCFIWQRAMAASLIVGGGAERTSILVEAVNMRNATKPPLPEGSVGNVFWWATAAASPEMEMPELGNMVSDAVGAYLSDDYVESIQGGSGYDTVSDYFEQLEALLSQEREVDIVSFTSWTGFGYTALDFGWGKPIWVAVMGKVGRAFRNFTVLVDLRDGTGEIEAWVTLDERRMNVLERDPYFLEFASPNPRISSL
ncbi:Stemmadenine O-acetyltransferase [Linum grandiflorum]